MAPRDIQADTVNAMSEPARTDGTPLHRDFVEEIVRRYRPALISFFLRRVKNTAEAEDLAQDVFFRLMRRTDASDIENAPAFLFQTAANLLSDLTRKKAIRASYAAEAPMREPQIETRTPERVAEAREKLGALVVALGELGQTTQDIFVLYHVENMKYREIADLLGISFSTVEKHLVKALAHLTRRVEGS